MQAGILALWRRYLPEKLRSFIYRQRNLLQIAIAFALFFFTLRASDLDLGFMKRVIASPSFWLIFLSTNLLVHFISTVRWFVILRSLSAKGSEKHVATFYQLFIYGWAGQFVGLAFWGVIGGDSLRVAYLCGRHGTSLDQATRAIIIDRISSILGLFGATAFVVIFAQQWDLIGRIALAILLFGVLAARLHLLLSAFSHLCKLGMVCLVLWLFIPGISAVWAESRAIMYALVVEAIPIGWQGMGLGHLSFATFLSTSGLDVYNAYFIGKIIFKLVGGIFFFRLMGGKLR